MLFFFAFSLFLPRFSLSASANFSFVKLKSLSSNGADVPPPPTSIDLVEMTIAPFPPELLFSSCLFLPYYLYH